MAAPIVRPAVASTNLETLPVVQLRTLARERLGSSTRLNGRRIAQATKSDLLFSLAVADVADLLAI